MCIHLTVVIRLPHRHWGWSIWCRDTRAEFSCEVTLPQLIVESASPPPKKKTNKTRLGLIQIRHRYKRRTRGSHILPFILTFVSIVQAGKPQNVQYVPSPAAALKQNKGLGKKNTSLLSFWQMVIVRVFFFPFCLMTKPAFSQSLPVSSWSSPGSRFTVWSACRQLRGLGTSIKG